jgi:hypothetical protein
MGAKNSKAKKGDKVGVAGCDDSPDVVDKTATLPASFKQKVGGILLKCLHLLFA